MISHSTSSPTGAAECQIDKSSDCSNTSAASVDFNVCFWGPLIHCSSWISSINNVCVVYAAEHVGATMHMCFHRGISRWIATIVGIWHFRLENR